MKEDSNHKYCHTFNSTTSTALSTLEMSHKLYRLLCRSYILSEYPEQSQPLIPGEDSASKPAHPNPCADVFSKGPRALAEKKPLLSESHSVWPALPTGRRKKYQHCDWLIKKHIHFLKHRVTCTLTQTRSTQDGYPEGDGWLRNMIFFKAGRGKSILNLPWNL